MSWSLITNEWRLKLLAFGLAVLILGAVALSQNPPTSGRLTIPISYTVPPNIILINPPSKTTVSYSGLADVIQRVDTTNLIASVDATRALPANPVRFNIVVHSTFGTALTIQQPAPIAIQVDTRQERDLTVQVVARPGPGWSVNKALAICPVFSTVQPCKVHFDGPVSWETNIVATATLPGLVTINTIDSPNQQIVISNSNGAIDLTACRTQPCASVDTNTANLHIEATAGASSSTVPLNMASPTHPPPAGYQITGVTVSPATVIISGDPASVGRVQRIILPGPDLSGSTSNATFQVAVTYPNGTTGTVQTATVTYAISKNPVVSPSP